MEEDKSFVSNPAKYSGSYKFLWNRNRFPVIGGNYCYPGYANILSEISQEGLKRSIQNSLSMIWFKAERLHVPRLPTV